MATIRAAVSTGSWSDLEAVAAQALDQPSLCAAFQLTAAANAERPALRTPDGSVEISWGEYAERIHQLTAGLASLGVGPGDTVALVLTNRPEFHLVDTAVIHLGAAPFSVSPTTPAEKIVPLLEDSGTRVLVTEAACLERARETRHLYAPLEHLVVVDGDGGDHLTLGDVEVRADLRFDFEAAWQAVGPHDVLTLDFTSGRAAVRHTHGGLLFALRRGARESAAGRVVSHYSPIVFGSTITAYTEQPLSRKGGHAPPFWRS